MNFEIYIKARYVVLALICSVVLWQDGYAQNRDYDPGEVVPGQIILKIESPVVFENLNNRSKGLGTPLIFSSQQTLREAEDLLKLYGLTTMNQAMSSDAINELNADRRMRSSVDFRSPRISDDLSRTYLVQYMGDVDPFFLSSKLKQIPGIAYAEPKVMMHLTSNPNDPFFGQNGQDYFVFQNFINAWAVTTSSRDIVIAIIDSGVDYNHPDLKDNLWRNPEPGKARDFFPTLFNAVVNDTIGWNFWESGPANNPVQNNNPIGTAQAHGTHVAGIAAAQTNNGIGIASSGYNSTYMAVRAGGTSADPRAIAFGYEGIIYAAINGADVINCSFGSDFRSEFGSDVMMFANELGAVVIGAAGNNNNDVPFYPAAYDNVLSVASVVNTTGVKSGFSSYGYYVDVSATGTQLLSTVFNSAYALNSGTSMSAPVVAGLAALVRHQYPTWSPERIAGQIRGTANKVIYASNSQYLDKLGAGLIDAHKAVTVPVPYIKIDKVEIANENGSKLGIEEPGFIDIQIANFGSGTTNLTYQISSINSDVATLTTNSGTLGNISTNGTATFRIGVTLDESAVAGTLPLFKITFIDQATQYEDFAYFRYDDLLIDTHDANLARVSFTSNGAIGFNRTASGLSGVGFVPLREINDQLIELGNILYEGGIMIEYNVDEVTHMVTNVRETGFPPLQFKPVQLYAIDGESGADQFGRTAFNTDYVPGLPKMIVEMKTYAFVDPGLDKSILVYYTVTNNDPSRMAFNDVYFGAFADWDIANYSANSIHYNETDSSLVVSGSADGDPYATVAHLGGISSAFAINNAYEGPIDSLNFGIYYSAGSTTALGFTEQFKSWSLKSGTLKTEQTNTDVSLVAASGPFTIAHGQSIVVGFVYAFGDDEEDLINQVRNAREKNVITTTSNYNQPRIPVIIPTETAIVGNYPNPFNPTTNIVVDLDRPGQVKLEVYDILGRKVDTIFDGFLNNRRHVVQFNARNLAGGAYIIVMTTRSGIQTRNVMLLK